jgi:hypothetical protein
MVTGSLEFSRPLTPPCECEISLKQKQNTIIMKKKVLVTALSVMTVTLLCVFTLAPISQAQSSSGTWSGDKFCEKAGEFICLPEVVVRDVAI